MTKGESAVHQKVLASVYIRTEETLEGNIDLHTRGVRARKCTDVGRAR